MPAILLAVTGLDPQPWEERMRALAPQRDIYLWPQRPGDPADIAYACAWHAPRGLFARLPRLRAIFFARRRRRSRHRRSGSARRAGRGASSIPISRCA
jgi:hypothetical protein